MNKLMQNSIHIPTYLRAINKIMTDGVKTEQGYILNGITAASDYDGYTCTLSNDNVTFSLFFHNKYDIKSTSSESFDAFNKHILTLATCEKTQH